MTKNPNDYIYVSQKHFDRKKKIMNGDDQISNMVGKPGPITGLILSLFDIAVTLFLRLIFNLLTISTYAFNWVNNITFGNFTGIIPTSGVGKVISMKFIRYTMTVLMPPFGVLLSKGLYGWFNIFICMVLTYVNFIAGIVYAFVITNRNRYADQYEEKQLSIAATINPAKPSVATNYDALMATVGFVTLLGIVIYFFLGYF